MTRVLLVTGARSLATRDGAERWARALLREALAGVDLLIVGDAQGPDAWAGWAAVDAKIPHWIYCVSGVSAGYALRCYPPKRSDVRWAPPGTSTGPLARNAAMVRDAARLVAEGGDVCCLALLDGTRPAGSTRGTEHTAALAERAGLTVRREVWTKVMEVSDG